MPLYEYECTKCHHRFEKIMKFSDRPVTKCPECGGKVEQMISAPAVQFKGSGWYVTDYAKKSSSGSSADGAATGKSVDKDSSGKDSKDTSSKSEAKSEAKPESKSETKSEPKSESKKSDKKKA